MKIIIKKKTPQWHKPVQVALVLCFVLFIFFQLRPEKIVEMENVVITPFIPDEISRDGAIVTVPNITEIQLGFRWISPYQFVFSGTHLNLGSGKFEIDLQSLSVTNVGDDEVSNSDLFKISGKVPESYDLLHTATQYKLFYVRDEGLIGIYTVDVDGNVVMISNKMALNTETGLPVVVVSENEQKIIYFEDSTGKIVTYDFTTKKKKIIQTILSPKQMDKVNQYIRISPKGGFVLYKDEMDLIYVFGADSGRKYVDGIMGINAKFSDNEGYLYYLYQGAMETDFAGTHMGIVDLSKGEIKYDTSEENENYFVDYTMIPNSDRILYVNGIIEEGVFIIDAIESYTPETNEKTRFNALSGLRLKSDSPFTVSDDLVLMITDDEDYILYNIQEQRMTTLTNLSTFLTADGTQRKYLKYDHGYIFVYGNAIYRYDHLGSMNLMSYENELQFITLSPDNAIIGAFTSDQTLHFSDKLSEVY